jgi:hypothetical protein
MFRFKEREVGFFLKNLDILFGKKLIKIKFMIFAQCSADYLFYDVQNILTVQYYTLLQRERP